MPGIEAGVDRTPASTKSGTYLELVHDWIVTVDHKKLGILYISYALVFMLVAGSEALMIRIQLFYPHNDFVSPFAFNRLFTGRINIQQNQTVGAVKSEYEFVH